MNTTNASNSTVSGPGSTGPARSSGRLAVAALLALLVQACPSPDPPKTPVKVADTEMDARAALDAARKKDDAQVLLDVFNRYPKFNAGKQALKLAVRKLKATAIASAEDCDEPGAKGALAKMAPYTSDDREVDALYDEANDAVKREKSRCVLVKLDDDVKRAEGAWDWPRAFHRITSEKDADGGALKKRRVELTARWLKWLDATIDKVVEKKSLVAVVGDKRELFLTSVDAGKLPIEVADELGKRSDSVQGVLLLFDKLEGGVLLDPPQKYWVFGNPTARRPDAPSATDGTQIENGIEFFGVGRGKAGGTMLILAVGPGKESGKPLERLGQVKILIPESAARTYDTNAILPPNIVGMTVLAPVAAGSDLLTPSKVITDAKGVATVQPKKGGFKVIAKRADLRGMTIPPGTTVQVLISGFWKAGELSEPLDLPQDRALVKVGGFDTYFPLSDLRVKRGDLPAIPKTDAK